jgi:hypothetical protein
MYINKIIMFHVLCTHFNPLSLDHRYPGIYYVKVESPHHNDDLFHTLLVLKKIIFRIFLMLYLGPPGLGPQTSRDLFFLNRSKSTYHNDAVQQVL